MDVRQATDEETDDVAELRLAFIADHRATRVDQLDATYVEATRAWVHEQSTARRTLAWLAREGDEAIGVVSVVLADVPPRPDDLRTLEGYVINLYVVPAARRRGVAKALMAACEGAAQDVGARALYLYATDEGRHLYESTGFEPDPRWMRKPLGVPGPPNRQR